MSVGGQMVTVKLSRGDPSSSWGFRLQGGKDFGTPLAIQRVNPNSLATQGGLQQEDVVLSINGQNAEVLRHKEAQEAIIRAGNYLEIAVQRGGTSIWKPKVTPVNKPTYTQQLSRNADPAPLTKTSLAANKQESQNIGSGHNTAARPFGGGSLPAVVNKQYNSPVNLYSMDNIAEALSAQTEVLATGAVGINFMKDEKPINTGSAVYQLVHQDEGVPQSQNHVTVGGGPKEPVPVAHNAPASLGLRHVEPPKPKPKPEQADTPASNNPNLCAECGRLIVGVFVRVKDRSLHAECFRCATCGSSLKNVGYYNVNDKLYCDIHAKQAANMIGQNPSLEPITVAPGGHLPLDTPIMSIGSNQPMASPRSLGANPPMGSPRSPGNPSFTNISPVPFHRSTSLVHHVDAPVSPCSPRNDWSRPRFPTVAPPNALAKPKYPTSVFNRSKSQNPSLYLRPQQHVTDGRHSPLASILLNSKTVEPASNTTNGFPLQESVKAPISPAMPPGPAPACHLGSHIYTHPQTAPPADTHRPNHGGSKFIWPPPKGAGQQIQSSAVPEGGFQSNASQALPTYRPPPGTQHVNFSANGLASPPISQPSPVSPKQAPPVAPKPTLSPGTCPWGAPPAPIQPLAPLGSSTPTALNSTGPSGLQSQQGQRPAPRRGRGQLKQASGPGTRIPICSVCGTPIRGPFIVALGKTWCPDHFLCNNNQCRRPLADVGFVEEQGQLYCENCWESYLAPVCCKCQIRIKGDCLNALDKQWHPECFVCSFCHKPFGNSSFYLEDGKPYCEKDWNELFTTKCVGCGFPIEAGDRWVEALNNNYHSQCFKCTICQKNLEGQSFYAKGGRPFCKAHAR